MYYIANKLIKGPVTYGVVIGSTLTGFLTWLLNILGSKAVRSATGSPFIKTFCEVVKKYYRDECLMDMVLIMTSKIKEDPKTWQGIKMTVPSTRTSIAKKIFFGENFKLVLHRM